MTTVSIIGAGAWGTALATIARRAGLQVIIYAREIEVVDSINNHHENKLFLPGYKLDPLILATHNLQEACANSNLSLLVTPAQHLRNTVNNLAKILKPQIPIIICSKGIEQETCALMSEVATEVLPNNPKAVLSGPTLANEVAQDLPTAITLACENLKLSKELAITLANPHFRIYHSTDIVGAEIGGAAKNVLAIACGIARGRKMGENTRAALITRGLVEIIRLAKAKGAKIETLVGLSGVGDLILTCNALKSRNFSLGVALGQGQPLEKILENRQSVAEGVFTAESISSLGRKLSVEMPICNAVDSILNFGSDIDQAISSILRRPFVPEII